MGPSTPTTAFKLWSNLILCLYNVDTLNICMKEFIIFVCTDSTEIFFSKLRSAGLNYNLPSFLTFSYCGGGGGGGYLISIAYWLFSFTIIPELRNLKLTFYGYWIRRIIIQIMIASLIYFHFRLYLKTSDHLSLKLLTFCWYPLLQVLRFGFRKLGIMDCHRTNDNCAIFVFFFVFIHKLLRML